MHIKAEKLPVGTELKLRGGSESKDRAVKEEGCWIVTPAYSNSPSAKALYTDDMIDSRGFEEIELPEGYNFEDFDQEMKFLSIIRNMPEDRFNNLIKLLEGGTL